MYKTKLSYYLKCPKNTKSKNPGGRIMVLSNCSWFVVVRNQNLLKCKKVADYELADELELLLVKFL